jgi:nicotinate phosphoribosyltransferase
LPGEPLLQPVLRQHRQTRIDLAESRRRLQRELQRLPDQFRRLEPARPPYPVRISERLQTDLDELRRKLEPSGF